MAADLEALIGHVFIVGGRAVSAAPPGALVELPPRRPQRGRENDTFFTLLTPLGGNRAGAGFYEQLAKLAADFYFRSSSSVTSGLREAISAVNSHVLEHNQMTGARYEASIVCLVLRGRELFTARQGESALLLHQLDTFTSYPEVVNEAFVGHGLGHSPVLDIKLSRHELEPGHVMAVVDSGFKAHDREKFNMALGAEDLPALIDALKPLGKTNAQAMVIQFIQAGTISTAVPPKANSAQPSAVKSSTVKPSAPKASVPKPSTPVPSAPAQNTPAPSTPALSTPILPRITSKPSPSAKSPSTADPAQPAARGSGWLFARNKPKSDAPPESERATDSGAKVGAVVAEKISEKIPEKVVESTPKPTTESALDSSADSKSTVPLFAAPIAEKKAGQESSKEAVPATPEKSEPLSQAAKVVTGIFERLPEPKAAPVAPKVALTVSAVEVKFAPNTESTVGSSATAKADAKTELTSDSTLESKESKDAPIVELLAADKVDPKAEPTTEAKPAPATDRKDELKPRTGAAAIFAMFSRAKTATPSRADARAQRIAARKVAATPEGDQVVDPSAEQGDDQDVNQGIDTASIDNPESSPEISADSEAGEVEPLLVQSAQHMTSEEDTIETPEDDDAYYERPNLMHRIARIFENMARAFVFLMDKLVPEASPDGPKIPNMLAAGAAVFIPVVVVFVVVALRLAQVDVTQFEQMVAAVQTAAGQAETIPLTDVKNARLAWTGVIQRIDEVEATSGRGNDPILVGIRNKAQAVLDTFLQVTRRDLTLIRAFDPGLPLLGPIVRASTDMYVLNTKDDTIWYDRLNPNNNTMFRKSTVPIVANGQAVSNTSVRHMVDIAWMAEGSAQNSIVALDTQGILVVYSPVFAPASARRLAGVDLWQQPVAMSVWRNRLYILDVAANEIWRYIPVGDTYPNPPEGYFDGQQVDLTLAVDLSIDSTGNIYILFSDGKIKKYNGGAEQPFDYSGMPDDGIQSGTSLFLDADSPLPAMYVADGKDGSIFHMTLGGKFLNRFKPKTPLAFKNLTDIYVDQNNIYASADGSIYYFSIADLAGK